MPTQSINQSKFTFRVITQYYNAVVVVVVVVAAAAAAAATVAVVVVSLLRMCQTHKHIQSNVKHLNEIKDLIKI